LSKSATQIDIYQPDTGERAKLELPDSQIVCALFEPTRSFRSLASVHILAALLNSPGYNPVRQQDGEMEEQAYARRACDYADALLAELQSRQAASLNPQLSTLHAQST
jgi:hypothetical protein